MSLQSFTDAYIEALLWSSTDESDESGGEPLDRNYDRSDIAPEALATIEADCARFYDEQSDAWSGQHVRAVEWSDDEMAGHDFWLTRNGHGAGFWDGDWSEPFATDATAASTSYGEQTPYVGDDGLIYLA